MSKQAHQQWGPRPARWLLWSLMLSFTAIACEGIISPPINDEFVYADGGPSTPTPDRTAPADRSAPLPDTQSTPEPSTDQPGTSDTQPDQTATGEVYYIDVYNGLFKGFCAGCHNASTPERSRTDAYWDEQHPNKGGKKTPFLYWAYAYQRVLDGEMPQYKVTDPTAKANFDKGVALFTRWAEAGFPEKPGAPRVKKGQEPPTVDSFPSTSSCQGKTPMVSRLWRLTNQQVRNSITDVFGSNITLPTLFFEETRAVKHRGLTNNASDLTLDGTALTELYKQFELISTDVIKKHTKWKNCLSQKDNKCVGPLIDEFGRKLWRRTLTADERSKLLTGFDDLAKASREEALRYVIERILLSPKFLLRSELGQDDPAGTTKRLTHHEVADFLAFTIWQSVPDETLIKAADDGKLGTKPEVLAQIQRMTQDQRASRGVTDFLMDWLNLRELITQNAGPDDLKKDPDLRQKIVESARQFIAHIAWKQKGTLQDLFSSDVFFANETIAKLIGVSGIKGAALQETKVQSTQRAGLLTHPAYLMTMASGDATGFVNRGAFFLEELTCKTLGTPPNNVVDIATDLKMKNDTSKMTERQFMEKLHSANGECNSCHVKIDPIGASFEIYDRMGVYRNKDEKGLTIDPSGKLINVLKQELVFTDAVTLIKNYVKTERFQQCVTLNLYKHTWGREPEGTRNCSVAVIYEKLKDNNFQLLKMYEALVENEQFFLRTPQ